jgi:polyhydroxybutyrate depolymerase
MERSARIDRKSWMRRFIASTLRKLKLRGEENNLRGVPCYGRVNILGKNAVKIFIKGIALITLLAVGISGCGQAPSPTAVLPPAGPATISPGDSEHALNVDGMERSYRLHVPAGLAADQPLPVVLIFHGLSGNADSAQRTTGFDDLADAYGFLVVYPIGSGPAGGLSWNAGGCCGYANLNHINETTFVRAILSDLGAITRIDAKRIYAAGFSNGAMLSYRLGCEMSDTFAAVAPVAGTLLGDSCNPQQPVAILHIHGLDDFSVPFIGGPNQSAGAFPSVKQSIATWVEWDDCPSTATVEQKGPITHTTYASCKNGTAVELFAIQGMGHTWPPPSILPASQIIWNFFVAHPKP